ncbi:MFS general substrate transporter [Mycena polygramma]|nr:MFS general substrate transporter [Mycena polygramma]
MAAPPAKHLDDLYDGQTVDPTYRAKVHVLNEAIQDIGMGRYQYYLFVCAGFGWFADSVWPLITGLILTPVIAEFHFNGPFLSLAANIGLLVGAIVWGLGSDVYGRKIVFNLTLLIAGIFGLAAGGSPNFLTLASLLAVVGVGVGGNLPIDSAVFLDLVPASHQYLLTVMSVFWSFGQLLISLLAWPLIANFSCSSSTPTCSKADNMGWRYLLFILGSPRFLVGIGNDQAAVDVIHQIAAYNSTTTTLSVQDLVGADEKHVAETGAEMRPFLSKTSVFTMSHINALFATRKMAISTSMLISLWGIIGLASTLYNSFLPFLLASRGAQFNDGSLYLTYRNQVILSVIGIPGAFLAGVASVTSFGVTLFNDPSRNLGLTGAFLFASTTARSSVQLLGWNCGYVFFSNIMYGVLYAISPEIFPAKDRGTGNALTSTATRVFGVIAPVIALYANLSTAVPVYISGALIIGAGALALFLPFEPRGKASM